MNVCILIHISLRSTILLSVFVVKFAFLLSPTFDDSHYTITGISSVEHAYKYIIFLYVGTHYILLHPVHPLSLLFVYLSCRISIKNIKSLGEKVCTANKRGNINKSPVKAVMSRNANSLQHQQLCFAERETKRRRYVVK